MTLPQFLLLASLCLSAQDATLAWRPAAPLGTPRTGHCAVALDDERIFVIGGAGPDGPLDTTEIYGPGNEFQLGPALRFPRTGHTCTLLDDGRLLVAGGSAASVAEVYDPATSEWTATEGDPFATAGHSATLLANGHVLLAGGTWESASVPVLALFDPAANAVHQLGATLIQRRAGHIAARLGDARILLAGGHDAAPLASAEIFDPATETIHPAAAMGLPRDRAAAAVLNDGRVLVLGGTDGATPLGNAETYIESENWWAWVQAPMITPRTDALALQLPSGLLLVAGGERDGAPIGDTEVFDAETNLFEAVGALTAPRARIAGAVVAGQNAVLAVGGSSPTGPSPLCGLLVGVSASLRLAGTTTKRTQFDDGERIEVVLSGFSGSLAVNLTLRTSAGVDATKRLLLTTARPTNGVITATIFQVALSADLGKTYILSARQGTTIATTVETRFDVRLRNVLEASLPATLRLTGNPFEVRYKIRSNLVVGTLDGSLNITAGPLSRTISVASLVGAENIATVCCITTPGTYPVSLTYSGNAFYMRTGPVGIGNITIAPNSTTISGNGQIPLFTDTFLNATVSPAVTSLPAPTGSVTISKSGFGPVSVPLSPRVIASPISASTGAAIATFRYKATFADRPNTCFNVQYPGDANYPASSGSFCLTPSPGRTTTEILQMPATVTFGSPVEVLVRVKFPPELGMLVRSFRPTQSSKSPLIFTPLGSVEGTPLTSVGIGEASALYRFNPIFDIASLRVEYPGGGDLTASGASAPSQMQPITPSVELSVSFGAQPLTLLATIQCPSCGTSGERLAPRGTIRFFDGDLLLGQVAIAQDSIGQASLGGVIRPVGTRNFRAVYDGDVYYLPAASPVVLRTVN